MKIVCEDCGIAMTPIRIGISALEYKDKEKKEPYRLWKADIRECSDCKISILVLADKPYMYEHDASFPSTFEMLERDLQTPFVKFY